MLDIHLFGKFRKFAIDQSATANSILELPHLNHETMADLLNRIGIKSDEIGEILINFNIASLNTIIPGDNSRISIFPLGMHLLCGASHLKGHSFIVKKQITVDYYGKPEIFDAN